MWPFVSSVTKWPLWRGGRYGEVGVKNDNLSFSEYKMFIVLSSCLLYLI